MTAVESDQKYVLLNGRDSSRLIALSNLSAVTAANNSSLGTVIGRVGARWDFFITNEQRTTKFSSTILKYETAPYATVDASAK